MMSVITPVIKEIAKLAATAAETGKSAKKGGKGKDKEASAVCSLSFNSQYSPPNRLILLHVPRVVFS